MKSQAGLPAVAPGTKPNRLSENIESRYREAVQLDLFPDTLPPHRSWLLPVSGIALIALLLLYVWLGR